MPITHGPEPDAALLFTAPPARPPAVLRHFSWDHLPPHLQAVSRPFADLAHHLARTLPPDPQRDLALQRLLDAKDAAVRAAIAGPPPALPVTAPQAPSAAEPPTRQYKPRHIR